MHLFHFLPVLSLLLRARASSLDSHTCAVVSGFIYFDDGYFEQVSDLCICLSAVDSFVESLQLAAEGQIISGTRGQDILTNLIETSSSAQTCDYPDNSVPFCITQNVCAYGCQDGFTYCGGLCVSGGLCPSQALATNKKRSSVGRGSCTDMGLAWVACGVPGAGPRAWECVNAARDLESCGGCTFPLTAYSPIGEDCSALPGVADVSCLGGECVVHRCLPGNMLAFDGRSCIRTHHLSQPKFADPEAVPARVYGLEHVPLGRN